MFGGVGFGVVRHFLWGIVLLFGGLVVGAVLLSWHFDMDVSVEARGRIEPQRRSWVKSEIDGIVRHVWVWQGQQVQEGEVLIVMEDEEWSVGLSKVEKDMEVNYSRRQEIAGQLTREKALMEAELVKAGL
tara:strand:- start:266 stop:655 length:390 start_codon:yes stop_codon:yes gene_type:complete